jgi:Right handed beta helix region
MKSPIVELLCIARSSDRPKLGQGRKGEAGIRDGCARTSWKGEAGRMSSPAYRLWVNCDRSSRRLRLLAWWGLVAGAAIACTDQPGLEPTSVDSPSGPLFSTTISSNLVTPDTLTVSVGGTATATCQPLDRSGTSLDRNCNWRSRDTTVATVTGSGTQTGHITGRKQGKVWVVASATSKRDSLSVTVGSVSSTDPLPSDPTPTDPTPTDPTGTDPLPQWPSPTAGCPSSGYLRLVNVSTDAALSSALSNAQPGDQIRVAAGTYSNSRSWSKSGTAANPITLCGLSGARPVLKGGTFSSSGDNLIFTGLIFEGATTRDQANLVYLHNCHDVTFTRNEIRGGHYHAGLSVDGMYNVKVTYNYIHDNGHDTSHDHGIYWKTTNGLGNLIADNVIARSAARGISLHDNNGTGVFDVVVTHNTVVYNGSQGILLNNGDRNIVANNLLAFNGDLNTQKQLRIVGTTAQGITNGNHHQILNNLTWSPTASRAGIANENGSPMSGNIVSDARLVSAADFHLQAGSPAIGLALQSYTWGTDYDGRSWTTPPDAGAYER